ncbi:MAG: DUF499 domain-containing protein [Dehalococcoidia bacterium]|nr:DUF499 domain-containing protein [Dehalococcoidia bacterium]
MAITNTERVGKALDLLRDGLRPFVEREVKSRYSGSAADQIRDILSDTRLGGDRADPLNDIAVLLVVMDRLWGEVFRLTLGRAERSLVNELIDIRNKWAHQNAFSGNDTYRALDSASRLLTAVSASQAEEVEKMSMELQRVRFDEQVRSQQRRSAGTVVETQAISNLKPWRDVVTPHPDVASGRYQQAEFAADLWQVHLGEGSDDYRNPVEFFRRTYLTVSLKQMLTGAILRLSGNGSDPVVQLQTNFGGGKTHSMLALFHLFSGAKPSELAGIDAVMADAGVTELPRVAKPVVLVGNKISPGNPTTKPDGTVVRTLWGELAWQLGGRPAFDRIRADDENATNPGDRLRELLEEYGPALILIDEWVAYARQLHDAKDLPAGDFDTHFTFAQALTESAKLAENCLLVISLPASDTGTSPHAQADDIEVGGQRGREALQRLQNVIGRVESSWRPASAEEGFEIVRRRLFQSLEGPEKFTDRDTVARAFADLYRTQHQEFPPECRESDYERRTKDAYPIHPEVFDRLYGDWSTLVRFQRTRGVLRLMAAVIHSLWEKGDRNPLILPCNIPIDDPRVQFELTRYLPEGWVPVIERDVDGSNALPLRIDGEVPNLGRSHATRRVARTIYLGSAPTAEAAHRGIEDRRIKLGCVMPGESPAIFGDALRRLSAAATYLYADGNRYWYSTQPTVTKMAEDRAEQLKREPDKVSQEIERRIRMDVDDRKNGSKGDFSRVHPFPQSGYDVPDDTDARLVVLGLDHRYSRENNLSEHAAKAILESRGSAPRGYRNTLVFLAADAVRLQDLDEATRRFLAWDSILAERVQLELDPSRVKQAETQKAASDSAVNARIPETYQWLLVPVQPIPPAPVTWQSIRLSGQDRLAARASKKLRSDELLITGLGHTVLKKYLDDIPLWRGDHVAIRQLIEDFAQYTYLPRLRDPEVLLEAIRSGLRTLLWTQDSFAYAESFDEASNRYRGLRCGEAVDVSRQNDAGLLVRAEWAQLQLEEDAAKAAGATGQGGAAATAAAGHASGPGTPGTSTSTGGPATPAETKPRRFHGTASLDPSRAGRDASRIADEVIAHLVGLVGADVRVTLEIEADIPDGAPDNVVRTVTENSRSLKFTSQGFERE